MNDNKTKTSFIPEISFYNKKLQSSAETQQSPLLLSSNNILPLIKAQRSMNESTNTQNIKEQTLSKLDNQILTQLKEKITILQSENTELQRNYSALLLKSREDQDLIKSLQNNITLIKNNSLSKQSETNNLHQSELTSLKNQITQNESSISEEKRNYSVKIKQINDKAKEKELALNGMLMKYEETIKALKEDLNAKSLEVKEKSKIITSNEGIISSLQNELKEKISNIDLSNATIKEQNESINLLKNENIKLDKNKNKNNNQGKEFIEKIKQLEENQLKLKNEYDLLEKLYEREKEKEKENQVIVDNLNNQLNDMKSLLLQKEHDLNSISEEYDSFKNNEIQYLNDNLLKINEIVVNKDNIISEMESEISGLKKKLNQIKILDYSPQTNFILVSRKISNISQNNKNLIANIKDIMYNNDLSNRFNDFEKQFESKISKSILKIVEIENKIKEEQEVYRNNKKINEVNHNLIIQFDNLNKDNNTNKELASKYQSKYNNKKKELEEFKLKYETIFKENRDFEREIDQLKKNSINSEAFKQKILFFKENFQKIELTIETLNLSLNCRSCSVYNDSKLINKCGHSICSSCADNLKDIQCSECKSTLNYPFTNNLDLNEITKRLQYLNQIKEDIKRLIGESN